jgi:hypothetical protein
MASLLAVRQNEQEVLVQSFVEREEQRMLAFPKAVKDQRHRQSAEEGAVELIA